MEAVIILGASGHAVSVADIIMAEGRYRIACFLDRDADEDKHIFDIPVWDESRLKTLGIKNIFVAIGSNALRKKLSTQLAADGFRLINALSPHAYISPRASLGQGVVVMPHATIGPQTTVGDGVIVNTHASVDHDCHVGDFCHIAPGSTLCGSVRIGAETFIGVGAKVIDKLSIGVGCMVGAGAVVIRSVESRQTIVGVPAKPIKN